MKTDSNERPSRAGGAVLGLLLAIILFFGVLLWFPVTLALFLMQWGGHGQLGSMVGLLTMLIMLAIYTLWERRQYGDILLKAQSRTIHVKVAETRDHYLSPVFLSHTGVVLH
ncbi:MAG: hypothetical protein XE11_2140 [Methanomicrobiales archaeon 53_19]|nr:MAG: hypothetical protein XE11_2140 [Methanomicrobiales archaeon 53_19]